MSFMQRSANRAGSFDSVVRATTPGVGKQTLTEALTYSAGSAAAPPTAVQHRVQSAASTTAHDPARVQQVAQRGVAGPGAPLPHLGSIQRLFGRHDVTGVRAHADTAAADASRTIGAEAFTTGQDVAFAGAPSLHTAAHEAAHTVQQRGGVQLRGGVGAEGDDYEHHADAVADRVVRGESAEELLDSSTAAGSPGVQRKVTIGGLQTTAECYGPEAQDFAALVALVEAGQRTLDEHQRQELLQLWTTGDHHFLTRKELIHHVVGWGSRLMLSMPDTRGHQRATDPDGNAWFVSTSHENAEPPGKRDGDNVFDETHRDALSATRAKFLVQCAVAGGEMYRLILGDTQPEVVYTEVTGEPARASREVSGYREWPCDLTLDDRHRIVPQLDDSEHSDDSEASDGSETEQQREPKPITGLMAAYTTALFLGDNDLNGGNLGLVEMPEAFQVVKIDPEAALTSEFMFSPKDGRNNVEHSLRNPEVHEDMDHQRKGYFSNTFAGTIADSLEDEDNDAEEQLHSLLHSEPLTREIFQTITLLKNTPIDKFHSVIDRCISSDFAKSKDILKAALARRLATFSEIAASLPGYDLREPSPPTSHTQTTAPRPGLQIPPHPLIGSLSDLPETPEPGTLRPHQPRSTYMVSPSSSSHSPWRGLQVPWEDREDLQRPTMIESPSDIQKPGRKRPLDKAKAKQKAKDDDEDTEVKNKRARETDD